jgi:hypothetical protein
MQLILALPALFESRADKTAASPAPALAEIIALAGSPARQPGGIDTVLAAHYGVAKQTDWPLAAIRVAALGVPPGNACWLTADPVVVEVGLTSAELAGVVDDLDRAEADALLGALNAHVASDGLAVVGRRPDRFFVRASTPPRLSTVATSAALRRPLRSLLPQGPDAAHWRRWLSEIEMLLHDHPVNAERERTGRSQVGSLWLSEVGTLPAAPAEAGIATYATNGIASALAAFAGAPSRSLPADFRDAKRNAGPVKSIVVALDRELDVTSIEHGWAAPARDALAAGSLDSIRIIGEEAGDAIVWDARRPSLWQRIGGRLKARDLDALLDAARQAA